MCPMSEARIIKRYANRKLYDTQHSKYVTLEQIAEMIRHGDDVQIVDNKTKEDLTSVTLAQIIFEEEKKQKSFLPLQAMRHLIQNGGDSISQLVSQAQRKVQDILPRKGEGDEDEVETLDDVETLSADAGNTEKNSLKELREWVASSQRNIEEWQKKMDGRIRNVVVGGLAPPLSAIQSDVANLAARIAELEAKLTRFAKDEEEQA
jgi:polyhydroxyalkanoate synthesis repressor PhaR